MKYIIQADEDEETGVQLEAHPDQIEEILI